MTDEFMLMESKRISRTLCTIAWALLITLEHQRLFAMHSIPIHRKQAHTQNCLCVRFVWRTKPKKQPKEKKHNNNSNNNRDRQTQIAIAPRIGYISTTK